MSLSEKKQELIKWCFNNKMLLFFVSMYIFFVIFFALLKELLFEAFFIGSVLTLLITQYGWIKE